MDKVGLLVPELLAGVNRLVVESGHRVAGKKPGAPLLGRCDSFCVETDVHYPTDVHLLWDAMRCLIRETAKAATLHGLPGWRQSRHHKRCLERLFNRARKTSRARPEQVEAYLEHCRKLIPRSESTLGILAGIYGHPEPPWLRRIRHFLEQAKRHVDPVDRRLLQGGKIPQEEKVFSVFESHTRWIAKGKAGTPVELGVPVCILEDRHGFILHHEVMWQGTDVDHAVPTVESAQRHCPELCGVSFDRGFHSVPNRQRLDGLLEHSALPKKGRPVQADRQREGEAVFMAQRRRHPAVESAINNLEYRGLDRVRTHGAEGFARTVALSVLALNIHRIGLLLRRQRKKRLRLAA